MQFLFKKERGYTLIELLLVISIIGLITSLITANLTDSRNAGRDAVIKQQVRISATLFEYQRNEYGSYINYDLRAVGNDGVANTCADKNFQGATYGSKLRELCGAIIAQAEYTSPTILVYQVTSAYRDGNHFSIMAQLNSGDWYCVGSNGGTSEGPLDINANGCGGNP